MLKTLSKFNTCLQVSQRASSVARLASIRQFRYAAHVPYVFPHDDLFTGGIALLIIGLLILRVRVALQRRSVKSMGARLESSIDNQKGTPPLV